MLLRRSLYQLLSTAVPMQAWTNSSDGVVSEGVSHIFAIGVGNMCDLYWSLRAVGAVTPYDVLSNNLQQCMKGQLLALWRNFRLKVCISSAVWIRGLFEAWVLLDHESDVAVFVQSYLYVQV